VLRRIGQHRGRHDPSTVKCRERERGTLNLSTPANSINPEREREREREFGSEILGLVVWQIFGIFSLSVAVNFRVWQ